MSIAKMRRCGALAGMAALAACAATPAPRAATDVGTVRLFRGIWVRGFEVSRFEGCWLTWSDEAATEYSPHQPRPVGDDSFEMAFEGTMRGSWDGPRRYGHMGGYPCLIRVLRLVDPHTVPAPAR